MIDEFLAHEVKMMLGQSISYSGEHKKREKKPLSSLEACRARGALHAGSLAPASAETSLKKGKLCVYCALVRATPK